jgi:Carboxypeptidase regulatory-like domain
MKNQNYLLLLLLSLCSFSQLKAQFSISGQITCYGGGDPMENAVVQLSGSNISDMVVMTNANGNYTFPDLPAGDDYELTISQALDPLNGVSTFDLFLMAQHILGINTITNPIQLITLDVNGSGSITTFDLVLTRQAILTLTSNFPAWRFFTSDFDLATMTGSVDGATILNLQADEVIDFFAAKMGDVNLSAVCP